MPCPFLREGRARYCHAAAVRKLILDGPGAAGGGLCTSPEHWRCGVVPQKANAAERCPNLEDVHVQYCSASSVTKLVPFSESQTSPCTSDGYRYCDSYLSRARPHGANQAPRHLLFAPNHLWLDVGEAGLCHVGVDAFLAEMAGSIDAVTYAASRGAHRPAVSLTVNAVEWPLLFPNALLIQRVNTRLRRDPGRLTTDPYGSGWLFEGWELPGTTRAGLICGEQANAWLAAERERLAGAIHNGQQLCADGGYAVRGVARLLPHSDVVRLFQQFLSKTDWTAEA
jgi:glycine cleavage system H lipoate-binding protein